MTLTEGYQAKTTLQRTFMSACLSVYTLQLLAYIILLEASISITFYTTPPSRKDIFLFYSYYLPLLHFLYDKKIKCIYFLASG